MSPRFRGIEKEARIKSVWNFRGFVGAPRMHVRKGLRINGSVFEPQQSHNTALEQQYQYTCFMGGAGGSEIRGTFLGPYYKGILLFGIPFFREPLYLCRVSRPNYPSHLKGSYIT